MSVLRELALPDDAAPRVTGPAVPAALASPLAVAGCATDAVAACLAAAAELSRARTGRLPDVAVDSAHVAAAVRSEAHLRDPNGHGIGGFGALSRVWRAADGWVRTHANYPWHRAALFAALGVEDGTDAALLTAALADRAALDIERTVYAAGGLAVAARTAAGWADPTAGTPLVEVAPLGAGARGPGPTPGPGPLPASGFRVLDLTRVIAGPVGTRMLAALGADVLRVDNPQRPELPLHMIDGTIGKASTLLDAGTPAGRDALHHLLGEADVLVTGYRPGALRRLGLAPDQVAERHPGTIVVTLSAWGTRDATWGTRRGFDSLVQVATGIGWATSPDGEHVGVLPCQLLDHASGYLIAAGALSALAHRERTGGASHVSVALARTARWLLAVSAERGAGAEPSAADADAYRVDLGNGWSGIAPPGTVDGRPLTWPRLPPAYGAAAPRWHS